MTTLTKLLTQNFNIYIYNFTKDRATQFHNRQREDNRYSYYDAHIENNSLKKLMSIVNTRGNNASSSKSGNLGLLLRQVTPKCYNCLLKQFDFTHKVTLVRRQQRDLSVFESSCHLPTFLPHMVEASHCPFNCRTSSRKAVNTNFFKVFGLTRPVIEPEPIVSVADVIPTRPLIGYK